METGKIAWQDLTVPDAERIRDFYAAVAGWKAHPIDMGGYSDFAMFPGGATLDGAAHPVAGICHARGENAKIPPQWLVYITVADVSASAARCTEEGGAVLDGPRTMGGKMFCIFRDPAGAVAALIEP